MEYKELQAECVKNNIGVELIKNEVSVDRILVFTTLMGEERLGVEIVISPHNYHTMMGSIFSSAFKDALHQFNKKKEELLSKLSDK